MVDMHFNKIGFNVFYVIMKGVLIGNDAKFLKFKGSPV